MKLLPRPLPWPLLLSFGVMGVLCGAPHSASADVVLHEEQVTQVEGGESPESLWVSQEELARISGFVLKEQGLCLEDLCVPVGSDDGELVRRGEGAPRIDVAALARRLRQPYALDREERVWSFGPVPVTQRAFLERAQAPDFELADRFGRPWRLSEHRGTKLVLVVWASWCACREDLVVWEKLYRELRERGVEIVAIAEDAGGLEAAGPYIEAADTTHTSLIDPSHAVTAAFGLVNVPTAIWIDETGTIVRLDDGAYPEQRTILGVRVGAEGYADALRDWVTRGSESAVALSPEALTASLRRPTPEVELADQEFRLGAYFHAQGDLDRATTHWERAAQLAPDNWNYRRQEWADSGFESTVKFLSRAFGRGVRGVPYYAPIELPVLGERSPGTDAEAAEPSPSSAD